MAAPGGSMNIDATVTQVKRLINTHLKAVCKHAGLPVSGAKAALQNRIIDHLRSLVSQHDQEGLAQVRALIQHPPSPNEYHAPVAATANSLPSNQLNSHNSFHQHTPDRMHNPNGVMKPHLSNGIGTRGPHFKESPFFTILEPLTPVVECQAREANRDTVHTSINLPAKTADALSADRKLRALIYCTTDTNVTPFSRVDIAFPHQVEIKVNQDEVKGNLRGLKNKPGTTRPADITDLLRKRPGYSNDIAITYALTKNRYYLVVNLVRQITVESLVEKLKSGKIISRDSVIREMVSKAEDTDVIATSTILSLKCPLSTLRMDVPCRSTMCNHNQCFDAASFLQLQEQAPTWTCPICNKVVSFSNLHVDAYVDEILKSTPKPTEQVTIEPTGEWSANPQAKMSRPSYTDNEDDVLEIRGPDDERATIKAEHPQERALFRTPPVNTNMASGNSSARPNGGNKRAAASVVDLTLSSDEEEPPVRPKKRPNLNESATRDQSASRDSDLLRTTGLAGDFRHATTLLTHRALPQHGPR